MARGQEDSDISDIPVTKYPGGATVLTIDITGLGVQDGITAA